MSSDFNKICRFCVKVADVLLPLFPETKIAHKVMALMPTLMLYDGDGLPSQVCSCCVEQVNASYSFKLQCEASDVTLRNLQSQILQEEVNNAKNEYALLSVAKKDELEVSGEDCGVKQDSRDDDFSLRDSDKQLIDPETCPLHHQDRTSVLKRVVRKKTFVCHVCGKLFDSRKDLVRHMVIHTGEKPFECDVCKKRFSVKTNLKRHYRVHTGEKPFECEQCGTCFRQHNGLSSHLKTHSGQKPFSCVDCGKKFSRLSHMQSHLVCHTKEKSFTCSLCSKMFGRRDSLKKHMKIHSEDKPFLCMDCGKSFAHSQQLTVHAVCHSEHKLFLCGKTFSKKDRLKDYRTLHSGSRTFACPECGKAFVRGEHLRYHLKSMHDKK